MKKILYISLFLFYFVSQAQNLVPNPSFEARINCPDDIDQINRAVGWFSFGSSPDYLHICTTNSDVSIPKNYFGYQPPYVVSDSAYCALTTFVKGSPNTREFMGAQLTTPMTIGTKYYTKFKVSAAYGGSVGDVQCFANKIGVLFSTTPYDAWTNPAPINNFAHLYTNSIITDTTNWVAISGAFVADSIYKYIVIGNFFDDANTDTICTPTSSYAYSYVDDFCVSTDSILCNTETGLKEIKENEFSIYPNPVKDYLFIYPNSIHKYKVKIYSQLGDLIFDKLEEENTTKFDFQNQSRGIYVLQILSNGGIFTKKILVVK